MGFKVCILSTREHSSLSAFLNQQGADVEAFTKLLDYFVSALQQPFDAVLIDEEFLVSGEDYSKLRNFIEHKQKKSLKLYVLSDKAVNLKLNNDGTVNPEDFNFFRGLVKEALVESQAQEADVQENEIVIEPNEAEGSLLSDALSRETLNLKSSESIDEVGVRLCSALSRLSKAELHRGVVFKYLPNYCSLVCLSDYGFPSRKFNGIGLNFSDSLSFKAQEHLPKLKSVPAFQKMLTKIFGSTGVTVRTMGGRIEDVSLVLVYQSKAQTEATNHLNFLCDYADSVLSVVRYKKLYHLNRTRDELTGCFLKENLFEALQNEITRARRLLLPVSFFVIELDHYEVLKTKFNQERIKTLVKTLSSLLKEKVRYNDAVGRLSESRFGIVFPHMGVEDAIKKAKTLKHFIEQVQFFSDMKSTLKCTVSIGLGVYPNHIKSADDLFVGVEALLANKDFSQSIRVLKIKPGFKKDFQEQKLPDTKPRAKTTF